MLQSGRSFSNGNGYRYGFNGKENDNEVKGEGNQQDYGMRIYDPRLGRFLSIDPLTKSYPHYTPYSYAGNKPIKFIDLDGLEEAKHWYDYDITDLMNWLSKPSNPLADEGFVHKAATAFNRNFNPILPATVFLTGKDYSSSDYPRMTRQEAGVTLVTQVVLHKSIKILTAPNAAGQLEQQMAKNAAVMGQTVKSAIQTSVSNKTTSENLRTQASNLIRTETIGGNKAARTVGENIKIIKNGGLLAPVDVASINSKLYVIDGHHRLEAALRTGTELRYNILSSEQLKARGYSSINEVLQAAAEVSKVKIDSKIVNQVASGH